MRIDKYLSNLKYGTRSSITADIKNGYVKVNNKVETNNRRKIDPKIDKITYKDEEVIYYEMINIALYKPKGYLSANVDNLHQVAVSLIKQPFNRYDLKIAGRLDLDAEGLLILTTSGKFAYQITSPNNKIKKIYEVTLNKKYIHNDIIYKGLEIKDGNNQNYIAKALNIEIISDNIVHLTIDEGKFHQVKRMFKALDYEVVNLKRIQIGNLKLGDLKPGEYKTFRKEELL